MPKVKLAHKFVRMEGGARKTYEMGETAMLTLNEIADNPGLVEAMPAEEIAAVPEKKHKG